MFKGELFKKKALLQMATPGSNAKFHHRSTIVSLCGGLCIYNGFIGFITLAILKPKFNLLKLMKMKQKLVKLLGITLFCYVFLCLFWWFKACD